MSHETSSTRIASVILRATLAVIFIYHGTDKLLGEDSSWGANWAEPLVKRGSQPPRSAFVKLDKLPTNAWLTEDEAKAELPTEKREALAEERRRVSADRLRRAYANDAPESPPTFSHAAQYAVCWGELLGGFALFLGLLTRLAAAGMVVIQLGAIYFVTANLGLSRGLGVGYEYNVVLIAVCLTVMIMGGGGWSVDRFLHWGRTASKGPAPVSPSVPS